MDKVSLATGVSTFALAGLVCAVDLVEPLEPTPRISPDAELAGTAVARVASPYVGSPPSWPVEPSRPPARSRPLPGL